MALLISILLIPFFKMPNWQIIGSYPMQLVMPVTCLTRFQFTAEKVGVAIFQLTYNTVITAFASCEISASQTLSRASGTLFQQPCYIVFIHILRKQWFRSVVDANITVAVAIVNTRNTLATISRVSDEKRLAFLTLCSL